MNKLVNKDTRYYIDLDLEGMKIVHWDYGQRQDLKREESKGLNHKRIYITKGQYNKLTDK
jgi:hypothetical protein